MSITRSADSRAITRASRLESLLAGGVSGVDNQAMEARYKVWAKRQPSFIRLRQDFVLRGNRPVSPLQEAAASKSAALQVLLLSIFENQCRPPSKIGQATTLPLVDPTKPDETSWRYLVALPTEDRRTKATYAREPFENRVDQLKAALQRLESSGRVELRPKNTRDRFEGFRLLNEVAANSAGKTYYAAPTAQEAFFDVPVSFFLNGWVHTLTDNEIIAYLYLLIRLANITEAWVEFGGVPMPKKN